MDRNLINIKMNKFTIHENKIWLKKRQKKENRKNNQK